MSRFTGLTDGMAVVDIAEAEGGYNYYGSIRKNGEWSIMREKTDGTEYRMVLGASGYSAGWTARASQTYTLPTVS